MTTKGRKQQRVRETAVRFVATPRPETYHTTVTSKGRVTIPAALRKRLNITLRTRLDVLDDGDRIILKPMAVTRALKRWRRPTGKTERSEEE
jgi:AbrB family looped-hinge helix DNA binding protein